jgi:regulator of RNase E activity RraA
MNPSTETPEQKIIRDSAVPPSANLSDALTQIGLKFQTLRSYIRPVVALPLWGPAFTVQCYPGATWAMEEAIEKAQPGDVLVTDGESYPDGVLMGGLISLRAKQRGIAGAVIDGAVRDVEEMRQRDFPVYATSISPRSGTHDQLGGWGGTIHCAGVTVQPGDFVAGDDDGVVIIPRSRVQETLALAAKIEKRESFITRALERNLSLPEAAREYEKQMSDQ